MIFNSSLIQSVDCAPEGVEVIGVPAEEIAIEAGSPKCANMVMLGAYLGKRGHLTARQAAEALPDVLAARHHKTIPINAQALRRGAELALCHA